MPWSFRIGRVAGTEIKVHITFLALLAWFALQGYNAGGTAAALDRTIFTLGVFTCVLLHEFGHILVARQFGVRTPDVILLPIGGVARLERIPEEDRHLLLLKELEGYSVANLSEVTGLAESTIKVRLFRTRQRLVKAAARLRSLSDRRGSIFTQ